MGYAHLCWWTMERCVTNPWKSTTEKEETRRVFLCHLISVVINYLSCCKSYFKWKTEREGTISFSNVLFFLLTGHRDARMIKIRGVICEVTKNKITYKREATSCLATDTAVYWGWFLHWGQVKEWKECCDCDLNYKGSGKNVLVSPVTWGWDLSGVVQETE